MKYAAAKLSAHEAEGRAILILIDADADCAAELGSTIQAHARDAQPGADVVCAIACVEYETWLVASAGSLGELVDPGSRGWPDDPETDGLGKGWIRTHMRSGRYSETVDQPKLTARLDVELCASRSPSFARLVRALETHLGS